MDQLQPVRSVNPMSQPYRDVSGHSGDGGLQVNQEMVVGLHKMFLVLEDLDRDEMPPMDFQQTGTGTFHHLIPHKLRE